ncbi:c-type cytochrome biogenesis protein CcmI [Rhodobacter ferrooxidans]|uniref:Cytochrome c-type biogenesis protein CcmI n=1 Tax=Rhodobacter ferrooxidans TaxID=371731 RepID=C8RZC3_9RHOB|nr:c-type cytochrome biogenesis protein CcmI [Rhodobacter sp. SW2]EEW26080.1 cytochrome c-type biogenesis protein CcmI [Rhodobacter sp. SW2]
MAGDWAGGQDWMFWAVAAAVALMVAAILLTALWRGRGAGAPAAAYDLRVYRDQLAEIERDAARGVIAADEAARLRTEVSRRVLEADRALAAGPDAAVASGGNGVVISGLVVLLLAGAFWGYWRLGAPGYADLPMSDRIAAAEQTRTARPSQTQAEAQFGPGPADPATLDPDYLALVEKLRLTVKDRPDDVQGQEILANAEVRLGNFAAAQVAQARVIALKADAVTAEDHAAMAELMVMAAGGFVSPQAEGELTKAMALDPENGLARYYVGLMQAQIGRPDLGFQTWRALLEGSNQGDPWVRTLLAQIGDMAAMAGVEYQVPGASAPAMPGPSQGDMAAAAEMSEADRTAMIETMVGQLATRLEAGGGSADEWARLIGAYGVLGKTDEARAAWARAKASFALNPTGLETVQAAAQKAGVAE